MQSASTTTTTTDPLQVVTINAKETFKPIYWFWNRGEPTYHAEGEVQCDIFLGNGTTVMKYGTPEEHRIYKAKQLNLNEETGQLVQVDDTKDFLEALTFVNMPHDRDAEFLLEIKHTVQQPPDRIDLEESPLCKIMLVQPSPSKAALLQFIGNPNEVVHAFIKSHFTRNPIVKACPPGKDDMAVMSRKRGRSHTM